MPEEIAWIPTTLWEVDAMLRVNYTILGTYDLLRDDNRVAYQSLSTWTNATHRLEVKNDLRKERLYYRIMPI